MTVDIALHGARLLFAGRTKKTSSRREVTHPKASPTPIATIQPDLFAPSLQAKGKNRFAVLGDPGSGTRHQRKIARQLLKEHQKNPFASVLMMGDNCYEDGEPHLFESRIYKPYKKLFEAGVKFYPLLGNHDVRKGYGDAQLAYLGAPDFYNIRLNDDLELFALDTTCFLPGYEKCYTQTPSLAKQKMERQLKWLEKSLSESSAKFKLVFGHYPMYASGDISDDEDWKEKLEADSKANAKLREILEPLLVKYKVDLYLAAHEHHYERSKPIKGLQHIISGAAGKLREIFRMKNPDYPREKAIEKPHFMMFEWTAQGLQYQAIGNDSEVLDSGLIPLRQSQAIPA